MRFAKAKKKGLDNNKLAPCPNSPNCVVSEHQSSAQHFIEPLEFSSDPSQAWKDAKRALIKIGGKVQAMDDVYLWATFSSRFMRYVDDVELRLDTDQRCIHMRSISRVGYSDLGVNRKRMNAFKKTFLVINNS